MIDDIKPTSTAHNHTDHGMAHSSNGKNVHTKSSRKLKKKSILVAFFALVIACVACACLFFWHKKNQPLEFPSSHITELEFPIYYARETPKGYKLNIKSVKTNNSILNFSYKYSSGNLVITEQALPKVIEQVNKTKQFNTPIGDAYFADLNGHTIGFIETGKTLIIISSSSGFNTDEVQKLMLSFKQI
jgi:hypothetical protein